MQWFESNKPDLTELFTRLQQMLAWKGVDEEKIASMIKLAVGFSESSVTQIPAIYCGQSNLRKRKQFGDQASVYCVTMFGW
jgi:hypothetical protein